MALKVLMNGALGRMGQAIIARAKSQGVSVIGIDKGDDPAAYLDDCDVVIDFSHHTVTPVLAGLAAARGKAMVVGTTGHTEEEKATIRKAAETIPMVWAGNYSIGVNLLFHLTELAAKILPSADYAAEIVELHHRLKIDAPSGTAVNLLEAIERSRPTPKEAIRYGREGITGARTEAEIAIHAVRGGDVVGEHTVYFFGDGERVELTHRATNRAIFASGALTAAQWVTGKAPGIYSMQNVLGFK
ncbi:MAG: 4-hydroxy-tetrahydrodipicolinate reductase [Verrucomicrobiota bacterium]|nr:4-hydroxy-tetrahydrodipicolinate reductase [Verrucomicrobiota bacterium]